MKIELLVAGLLFLIPIDLVFCFGWEDLGKKVGEMQDKTGQIIEGTTQDAKKWWDEEGDELTRKARRKARRTADRTLEQTQQAAEEFSEGYREYWDAQTQRDDGRDTYSELKGWLESVWGSVKNKTDKSPEEIMGDFQRWWEREGRRSYKDIKAAFFAYIMSIKEMSQG